MIGVVSYGTEYSIEHLLCKGGDRTLLCAMIGVVKNNTMLVPPTTKTLTLTDVIDAFPVSPSGKSKKLLRDAFEVAQRAHAGQTRASGTPYIQHPLATAQILASIGMDARTVAGGLLHDVPEDTDVTLDDIEKQFGHDIAYMIEGITKLGKIKLRSDADDIKLENWRRMFLAMGEDIRTVIIKLADRLHNMRTLEHLRVSKQKRIANETMEIFVPIANRLGIGEIKTELAELSFQYLLPKEYKKTQQIARNVIKEKEKYVQIAIKELSHELKEKKIRILEIHGRAKTLHSLYLKLQKHHGDIARIFDIVAVRLIVPDVAACYEALGIVHNKYHPMIGRIKDYISLPKPNGYQSLHTTVFGPDGKILEIQIRTQQMHDEAELGIAAHWLYEEKKKNNWKQYLNPRKTKKVEKKEVAWARQLRQWQKDLGNNPDEFLEGLKVDFLKNHIFAFTPKGDIIELPEGASVVDFAYAIHTDIGNMAMGAQIDGKMISLDTSVKNGQVIEIVTDKNRPGPNPDWLTFVKTSHAKSAIRKYAKQQKETDA